MPRSQLLSRAAALVLVAGAAASSAAAASAHGAEPTAPRGMVRVAAGTWTPFFRGVRDAGATGRAGADGGAGGAEGAGGADESVDVAAFFLDEAQVTNAQFAAFVRTHPAWRRSRVPRVFADASYLQTWQGDVEPGPKNPPDAPVTEVSWFAAKAFCRARGATLPTTGQWELASARIAPDARERAERIVAWYGTPTPPVLPSVTGADDARTRGAPRAMDGLVWEWVLDFNAWMTDDDGRAGGGAFCGAGADRARDPSDYATFMRYAFRSSLKASYTTRNLGFRCARGTEEKTR